MELDSGNSVRHVHSGDALQVLKQEQFSFRLSGQRSLLEMQEKEGVILGHKKPFSKRYNRLN